MPMISQRHLAIGLAMLLAAGLALLLTPRDKIADHGPKINLETMIPKQFGDWKVDTSIAPLQVSGDVKASLDEIYNQTLSRTYINSAGEHVMLSIAYGSDQSRAMQVHRPEVCYAAQGFLISNKQKDIIDINGLPLPVMHLLAKQGDRSEPITYWIMVGDVAARGNLELGYTRLKYGLKGINPTGILVRTSMISDKQNKSYNNEKLFIQSLLASIPIASKNMLVGVR